MSKSKMQTVIDEVGYWEASLWGASVTSYELIETDNHWNPTVRYYAIEHGEEFYFDIPYLEAVAKYKEYQKER